MHYTKSIDLSELESMHELLCRSAGYNVTLSEELDYFKAQSPKHWFVAKTSERPVGLIRLFPQSNGAWSTTEFYVEPSLEHRLSIASELLSFFSQNLHLERGHRLRIEVPRDDETLNAAIKKAGFSEKTQLFRHFEAATQDLALTASPVNPGDPENAELCEVMNALHPVTLSEIEAWRKQGTLRWLMEQDQVVCILQIYRGSTSAEINRLATRPSRLREGFAEKLIRGTARELQSESIERLSLKVEDVREAALALYRKCGFNEISEKAQTWHSRWY